MNYNKEIFVVYALFMIYDSIGSYIVRQFFRASLSFIEIHHSEHFHIFLLVLMYFNFM